MEIEVIIKEFKESTMTRKDFYVIVSENSISKAYDITAYKVQQVIRLDIREHKEI